MIKSKRNKSGQTLGEYLIIFAFISVVAISVLIALGEATTDNKKNPQAVVERTVQHKITVYDENPPTIYYSDGNVMAHINFISFTVNGKEVDISASSKYKVEESDNN